LTDARLVAKLSCAGSANKAAASNPDTSDLMPPDLYIYVRWIHVLAASAWFGEVVAINFILIPSLSSHEGSSRKEFLNLVFPKVFRMASILSFTAAVTGALLLYHHTHFDLFSLGDTLWGRMVFIGGTLGLLLTLFHFFLENQLARKVGVGCPDISSEQVEDVHGKLQIVPRIGLVVITTIYVSMMVAVRGV
jgi:uncharacterized membrane protein